MISRKNQVILFLSVAALTAVYLFFVKKDRQASIARYLSQPLPGDIYKMERKTRREGTVAFYLQVQEVSAEGVYFFPSLMTAWAPNDIFLKHFDSTETVRYSKKELAQISQGQWDDDEHDNTVLLEISRRSH
jgi:hypothetical protein